jgi:hypothetical protein
MIEKLEEVINRLEAEQSEAELHYEQLGRQAVALWAKKVSFLELSGVFDERAKITIGDMPDTIEGYFNDQFSVLPPTSNYLLSCWEHGFVDSINTFCLEATKELERRRGNIPQH